MKITEDSGLDSDVCGRTAPADAITPIRFVFGDFLLILYLAVIVRQFCWGLPSNTAAWIFSAITSIAAVYYFASHRDPVQFPRASFWFIAGIPLVLMCASRVMMPDIGFDTLNYHLVNGERALSGFPWKPGDFFPSVLPVNPAPDMIFAIARHILGYRLGTLPNLLATLWCACIIERMLRPYIAAAHLRYAFAVVVVSVEYAPYFLSRYSVDVLPLPLLLEATELAFSLRTTQHARTACFKVALLLGMAIAFKLTSVIFAVPVLLICAYSLLMRPTRIRGWLVPALGIALVLPGLPHAAFLYHETGNPVFPYYNAVFQSPDMAARNIQDLRHGPGGNILHTLAWPLTGILRPVRFGAVPAENRRAMLSGRMPLIFLAALAGLLSRRIRSDLRVLCGAVIITSWLWAAVAGEVRYGMYLEAIGAFCLVALLAEWRREYQARKLVYATAGLLLCQTAFCYFIEAITHDPVMWLGMQPEPANALTNPRRALAEARYLFRDRSLADFLSPQQMKLLGNVGVWIGGESASSGLEVSINPEAPIISTENFVGIADYFEASQTRLRLAAALAAASGKPMYCLTWTALAPRAGKRLRKAGLDVKSETNMDLPWFSTETRIPVTLMEVHLARADKGVIARLAAVNR